MGEVPLHCENDMLGLWYASVNDVAYLPRSVFQVVLQRSTPPHICQLILYYY